MPCHPFIPSSDPAPVVLIEEPGALAELLADRLEQLGVAPCLIDPATGPDLAQRSAARPPVAVVTDIDVSTAPAAALEALLAFRRWCPETPSVIFTATAPTSIPAAALRLAWPAVGPAAVVSKRSPVGVFIEALQSVITTGRAAPDPASSGLHPRSEISPASSPNGSDLERLVAKRVQARIWRTLLDHDQPPTYRTAAADLGVAIDTLRAWRLNLIDVLGTVGLHRPALAEMHLLAHTIRPLLEPLVTTRLSVSIR